ncbi:MAG TPA: ribosomal protein S18-alanine N-acetyltransferase [Atribacteraceae bacterium]|nr:ribosomal protein S18-alanine N-acetyltransferase [Atribacteraceae bacterium]
MVRRSSPGDPSLLEEGEFRIVEMKPHHLPYVVAIERKAFVQPWSYSLFLTELSNRVASYFIGLWDDRVAGYVGLWVVWETAHVTTFAIHPRFRQRGLGKKLLRFALDYSRLRNCREVLLEVRLSNTTAQELYRQFGFKLERVRKRYYSDGEDALVMKKNLSIESE